jgi:hypothetical protein
VRDERGRFKKVENIDSVNIFPMLVAILLVNVILGLTYLSFVSDSYCKEKDVKVLQKEAVERGYAIQDQDHFLWIEVRKAIIP